MINYLKKALDVGDMAFRHPYLAIQHDFHSQDLHSDVRVFMDQYLGAVAQVAQPVNDLTNK